MRIFNSVAVALCMLAAPALVSAQSDQGRLAGTVRDSRT